MSFEITTVEVWEGTFADRPGALSEQLAEVLRAGANLDLMISRPCIESIGRCTLFVAPLRGEAQTSAARDAGLKRSQQTWLRIDGPDRPWLGAGIARTVADADVNLRSLTGAAFHGRAVIYLSFDDDTAARRAAQVLTPVLG